jgi:hypothetical protein
VNKFRSDSLSRCKECGGGRLCGLIGGADVHGGRILVRKQKKSDFSKGPSRAQSTEP